MSQTRGGFDPDEPPDDDGRGPIKAATNAAATAAAEANPEKLTPREAELLAEVLAAYPTLSRDEALRQLGAAGV